MGVQDKKGRNRQHSGAVARTALSLLGLGLGSAVFGALVVGPAIGDRMASRAPRRSSVQTPASPTDRLLDAAFGHRDEPRHTESESHSTHLASREEPTPDTQGGRSAAGHEREPTATPETDPRRLRRGAAGNDESTDDPVGHRAARSGGEDEEAQPRAHRPRVERSDEDPASAEPAPEATSPRVRKPRPAGDDEPRTRPVAATPAEPTQEDEPPRRGARTAERATPRDVAPKVALSEKRRGEARTADPVEEHAGPDSDAETAKLYRVRVGKFESREEAEKLRDELKQTTGVTAFLVKASDGYRVQTGAYKHRSNAERIAGSLRSHSYRPLVTQE